MDKTGVSTLLAGCLALSGCGEGGRVELGADGADLLGAGHGIDHVVVAGSSRSADDRWSVGRWSVGWR